MAEVIEGTNPEAGESNSTVGHRGLFSAFDRLAVADTGRAFKQLVEQLDQLPDAVQLVEWSAIEQKASAQRLAITARMTGSTGDKRIDQRRARNTLGTGGAGGSTRTRNRDAKRAASIAANPSLGDRLADGTITPDALDHLIKSSDDTTGEIPVDLIETADGLTADQTAQVVERYEANRLNADEVRESFRRQHQARTVRRYRTGRKGVLAGLSIEGPDAMVDAMWANLNATADSMYRSAGGRDRPAFEHASLDHRRFDAVHAALTGDAVGSSSDRAAVVVTVAANDLFDSPDDQAVADQLGSGPIPAELMDRYLRPGPLAVLVTGCRGEPLWLGRARRRASNHQFLALSVRDRGCVLCRVPVDRCVAHHLMPWSAPGRGRTDIDQMALLCQRCHGDLHHRNHTLTWHRARDGTRIWATRPATPDETPAPKQAEIQHE